MHARSTHSFLKKLSLWGFIWSFLLSVPAWAQEDLEPYIASVEQAKGGMTLWSMITNGGFIMIVLGLMSIGAVAIIIYCFMTLSIQKKVPKLFCEDLIQKLDTGKMGAVRTLCDKQTNIIAKVVNEGLDKKKRGKVFAKEAMENCVRKEIGMMWQIISYLADIAAIAPLVGLLGTVIGMIQAFNVIAFQTAAVKPILLAGGVSKAMVTTAGGLIVAIPVMLFYAFFRGKVQDITNAVENYSSDIIKIIEEA